jgi:hypothetical protein
MIISFSPHIFENKNSNIQAKLAEILVKLTENRHFVDTTSVSTIFFKGGKYSFNETDLAKSHLSTIRKVQLEEYLDSIIRKSTYVTQLHKRFLTQLVIGENRGEIHPNDAFKIISERSKIILENGINDFKFIVGVCQKYTNHKQRGSIYQLIKQAIDNEDLEHDNAGGIGEIVKRINYWRDAKRFDNIYIYKLITVFDSDKLSKNDYTQTNKALLKFLKCKASLSGLPSDYYYELSDKLIWHMWYKKKLENYVPLSVLKTNIAILTPPQIANLESKTDDELDFIEYNKENIGIGKSNIKDHFPEMFLTNFSFGELEKKCEHHKVRVETANGVFELISEMEEVLIKIAKII